jgi:hypothetical protein
LEKNIEKIHKFQHKANPDENERISYALFTPSPSHPYMMKIFIDVVYLGDMIEKKPDDVDVLFMANYARLCRIMMSY